MSSPTRPSLPAPHPAIIAFAAGLAELFNRDGVRDRIRSVVMRWLADTAETKTAGTIDVRVSRTYQTPDGVVPGVLFEPDRLVHRSSPLPICRERGYEPEDCIVILAAIYDAYCNESEPVIVRPGGDYNIEAVPHRVRWEMLMTRHVPQLTAEDVPDLKRYLQAVERELREGEAPAGRDRVAEPSAETGVTTTPGPALTSNQHAVLEAIGSLSELATVPRIEELMETGDDPLHRRTIGPIVKTLIELGLVDRPQVVRSGCGLTIEGRKRLASACPVQRKAAG